MRGVVKAVLGRLGLLDATRRARDAVVALGWVRHNRRFLRRGENRSLPVPTARLLMLTTASPSVEWFIQTGRAGADSIREQLERHAIPLGHGGALLDFGCGCGRIIRHWADLSADVHGCDYNPLLIDWCRRQLPFAHFETNALEPPLPYADARFDLIYALSVFTHLPEPLQSRWVAELARVLRPGGHLIISTHGEAYLDTLSEAERARFNTGQLVVRDGDSAGSNRCGVFFSADYVRRHLEPRFRLREHVARGARGNPPQDLALLQLGVPSPSTRTTSTAVASAVPRP
jgi:SAM-dependent methyltransferase